MSGLMWVCCRFYWITFLLHFQIVCGILWDCSEWQPQYNTYIIIFIKVKVGLKSGMTQGSWYSSGLAGDWWWLRCRLEVHRRREKFERLPMMGYRWKCGYWPDVLQCHWEACCWVLDAGCWMPGWAEVCPVHEASWPGSRRRSFCLDEVLVRFLLDASLAIYSFQLNCLSLVRWPLFIQVAGGQPALLLAGCKSL